MAMNENVAKVLEEQINKELFSTYLYLTFTTATRSAASRALPTGTKSR